MGSGEDTTEETCEASCDRDPECKGIEFMKTDQHCSHWYGALEGDGTVSEEYSCKIKPLDTCTEYQIIVHADGTSSY